MICTGPQPPELEAAPPIVPIIQSPLKQSLLTAAMFCGFNSVVQGVTCGIIGSPDKAAEDGEKEPPALDGLRAPSRVKKDPKAVIEFTITVNGSVKVDTAWPPLLFLFSRSLVNICCLNDTASSSFSSTQK